MSRLLRWFSNRSPNGTADGIKNAQGFLPSQYLLSESGRTLAQLSADQPVMVVLLRHAGCTFAREALTDLVVARPDLQAAGVNLALVHMGKHLPLPERGNKCALTDVERFSDPNKLLYREFGLTRGGILQLLGPRVWARGVDACLIKREGVGPLMGDGLQMPGVFVIYQGQRLASFQHRTAADRPDYAALGQQAVERLQQLAGVAGPV